MPIPFTCPHCGLQTSVSDQYAGRSGPCAGCGKTVTVPPLVDANPYAPPARRSGAWIVITVAVVLFGAMVLACVGFFLAIPVAAVPSAREAARQARCSANLRMIGLAMQSYQATYGCFPPAYVADENGRPMHSWRVLLLPYLDTDAQQVYGQYNFDEPWNSPQNQALAGQMPDVFRCPSDEAAASSETSYVMIIGPGTISDGPRATKIEDVTDGIQNTILVVEAAGRSIHWLEPRDLDPSQTSYFINDPVDGGIASGHPEGSNVLFCDGSVMFIDGMIDPEEVRAMCTISGGETVDRYSAGYDTSSDW